MISWSRMRSRFGRLPYATSRSVACRMRQRRAPTPSSRTTISASSSSWSSWTVASGSMSVSSSISKEYRKTAARLASVRRRVGSASSRAVTTACTVGGRAPRMRRGRPSLSGRSMPVVSTMKKGFPPVRFAISEASSSVIRPPPACLARSIDSSMESGSIRSSTALTAFDPQDGRSSKNSGRVSARVSDRRSPPRGCKPMRSTRSCIDPLSVWMSSTTITSGCTEAMPSTSARNPACTSWTKVDSSRRSETPNNRPSRSVTRSISR